MKKRLFFIAIIFCICGEALFSENLVLKETYNSINNLYIDLSYEKLEISNTSNEEIIVEIESNNNTRIPKIEDKNGVLKISTIKKLCFFGNKCTVKVYIPRGLMLEQVVINSASGDIDVSQFYCDELNIMSVSADVVIDEINTSSDSNIASASGEIEISDFSTQNLKVASTSGEINIQDTNTEYLDVKTTSGNISLMNIMYDYFDVKTISGSVEMNAKHEPIAKSTIESASGSVKISFRKAPSFDLEILTTSGRFIDQIDDLSFSPKGIYKKEYNSGGALLKIKTISGSIRIS
jgi:DUF4097 and DUF4098 domain-containing protein YvlB